MSNTIDKYIRVTFSIVTDPYPCHPYMFITENYSSKFTIMYFGLLSQNSLLKTNFLKDLWIRHCDRWAITSPNENLGDSPLIVSIYSF